MVTRSPAAPGQAAQATASAPRLPLKVQAALAEFQRRVLELFPGDVRQIVLFGSYARGDWREESDVDVMVVVGWQDERAPGGHYLAWYGDPRWDQIVDTAADVLVDRGVHISPLVIGEARRLANQDSILRRIDREGQTLWQSRQT